MNALPIADMSDDSEDSFRYLSPDKRLLANVLKRALLDFLSMSDKAGRVVEVATGTFDSADKYHKRDRTGKAKEKSHAREDRNLIRWFRSESKHPFSFLYIIEALDLDGAKEKILAILRTETAEDRPQLTNDI